MTRIGSAGQNGLISSGIDNPAAVEHSISSHLQERLGEHYSTTEIEHISALDSALFPADFELNEVDSNTFRSLARLSHCALKPAHLQSHRKIIGPFIVAVKKLIWKFMKVHLEHAFDGLQEFCSWMVYNQAKQAAEIDHLKKRSAG